MELCRWIKTEMRWKRNVLSLSSPETAEIFREHWPATASVNGCNDDSESVWKGSRIFLLRPVIIVFNPSLGTLTLSPERQSARMLKITNDGLARADTWCFVAVLAWQQWASKGWRIMSRDAPIIGWLLCRYRPIVIYYVLWWHCILKLHFLNSNGRHKFSFYIVIYAYVLVVLFSYALICCIIQ